MSKRIQQDDSIIKITLFKWQDKEYINEIRYVSNSFIEFHRINKKTGNEIIRSKNLAVLKIFQDAINGKGKGGVEL